MEISMSTIQVDGSSAVTSTSTNNNSGVAINIGSGSTILNSRSLGSNNLGVFGSTIVDNDVVDKALDGGVLAYNNERPVAKRTTTSLATVSNSVLLSGALQPQLIRGIHKLEVLRTRRLATAIRAGKWNIYKGKFLNNQNQTADNPVVAVDTLADDTAAMPTRSVPGRLVYRTGAKLPVQDTYKAKTA
jgi:hypothetical protein